MGVCVLSDCGLSELRKFAYSFETIGLITGRLIKYLEKWLFLN